MHISQISEERVDKIKNVLKVGQEVDARVIKIDKAERRIGLSIKAANYSEEDLKRESAAFDNLRPAKTWSASNRPSRLRRRNIAPAIPRSAKS